MLLIFFFLQAFLWKHGIAAPPPPVSKHGIVPKSQTKGVDFCGVGTYYYIIRSDLGCYMRSTDFHQGSDLKIFSLHNSVRGGDHYLAHQDDLFYIIKGNSYRRVSNLNKDSGAVTYNLHPNCQNGDHYFSSGRYFYIVFKKRGVFRRVTNMNLDTDGLTYYVIPEGLKGGLYYWGTKGFAYYVKPHDKWGVQYHRTTNFDKNSDPQTFSFHADVVNFLPGGMSINYGPTFGVWNLVSTIINDLTTGISKEYSITRKIGYMKERTKSTEQKWQVSLDVKAETGDLIQTLVKKQFSLHAEYGGMKIDTTKETWSDAVEITDKITFTAPPKSKVYIWQYKLGFGTDDVFYSRDTLAFTEKPKPPAMNPFEPAQN